MTLDYRKGKLSFNISAGITAANDWKQNTIETVYKTHTLRTCSNTQTNGSSLAQYIGFITDFNVTEKGTFGFAVNASFASSDWNEDGKMDYSNNTYSSHLDSIIGINYKSESKTPDISTNVNYRLSINSQQYLNIDLDYLNKVNSLKSVNVMNYLVGNLKPFNIYDAYEQKSPQKSSVWSGKIEYGNSLNSRMNLSIGVDAYYSKIDNDDQYSTRETNDYIYSPNLSNHFIVNEYTPALFVNLSKNWGDKIIANIGSRIEYTRYKSILQTTNNNFEHDYLRIQPSIYLNYKPTYKHNLSYNLFTRMTRPPFSSLNPFKIYTSPNSYRTGNPYLYPSETLSHFFQYAILMKYFLSAEYSHTDDEINRMDILKENNMVENKHINIGKTDLFQTSLSINTDYWKQRGSLNLSVLYSWRHNSGEVEGMSIDYISENIKASLYNYLMLSKRHNLTCNLGISLTTQQKYDNISYPASINMNFDMSKQINQWRISLYSFTSSYIYESKWTQTRKLNYETEDILKHTYTVGEATSIGIRVLYTFGKTQIQGSKPRNSSNSNIKQRLR